jgi:hypothetical protein
LCSLFGGRQKAKIANKWRCRHESKGYIGLHRVQTAQLQHNEKQKEHSRQVRDEQVLQILQETHSPQGNKVSGGNNNG